MADAYIYAPFTSTGYNFSGHSACNGGALGQMLDCLKNGATGSIRFFVSTNVKSVRLTRTDNCAPGCSQNHRNAVKAELYGSVNASGCYFGWVLYGHLVSPIANGVWNLSGSGGITVGYVVDYVAGQCSWYNDDDHVHMEASNGTRLVNW